MRRRTARCGCGRFEITIEGEPELVYICHCDFCQKRTGSVFSVGAYFTEGQVAAIRGDARHYNGLEVDGVGVAVDGIPEGVNFYFCTTCGSTVYWDLIWPHDGQKRIGIAVGNFVEPEFPTPTTENFTEFRHHWVVSPVPEGAA